MKHLKDAISKVVLMCNVDVAIVEKLEEFERRIYALEQNAQLRDTSILGLKQDVGNLKLATRQKVNV